MSEHIYKLFESLLFQAMKTAITITATKPLGGGCINHAMHLTTSAGDFFAKWNDQPPADLFVREAELLTELAKAGTLLKIPRVMAAKPLDDQPAVLITEYLTEGQSDQQDETLGRGIAELHQYWHEQYGFYHDNYCGATPQDNRWNNDWVEFFGQQRILHLVNLVEKRRTLSSADRQQYERLIDRLPKLIGHQPRASLNHGDLWSGNYLYTTAGPALIDPASYYADREFDLALMQMFGGYSPRVWAAYQEAYPLPPEWRSRQNLYMLYHYLNHYYLFGGAYGQQALSIVKQYL